MKRNMMRIVAVIFALMLTMGMSSAVFGASLTDGKTGTPGTAIADGVTISKTIVFVNGENTNVREPNITYEYTVAAVTVASTAPTVNDGTTTASVKSGVPDAITTSKAEVAFADTNEKIAATANGKDDTKTFTLTFNAAKFPKAGIYRYSVTESIKSGSKSKAEVGVTEASSYKNVRYLDVYVENTDSGKQIYGYVLFESETPTTQSLTTSSTNKSNGWVDTDTNTGDTTHTDVDVYTTQNVVITKATEGTLADPANNFPVTIGMTKASGLADGIKLDFAVANNGSLTKTGTDTNNVDYVTMDSNLSGTVQNTSTITITGIPAGSNIKLTEQNNTADTYKVKAGTTSGGVELLAEANVAPNASTSEMTNGVTLSEAKGEIYITNTLSAISPTNVVMRFAPFLFIFGAAILLLVMMRRRKAHNEE